MGNVITGDEISSCALGNFEKLPESKKPGVFCKKSLVDGKIEVTYEWNVLCAIVMQKYNPGVCSSMENNETRNYTLKCVSMGLGVKCLNELQVSEGHGEVILDSHAEVLCRRAFKKYIYENLMSMARGEKSIIVEKSSEDSSDILSARYIVDNGIKFHLYVSQSPCGDTSTEKLESLQKSEEIKINIKKREAYELSSGERANTIKNTGVVRGRLCYDLVGVMRTKPGRIDSIPTRSMSCADKISKWVALGLLGSMLSSLVEPIYLSSITIGEMFDIKAIRRVLIERNKGFCESRESLEILSSEKLFRFGRIYLEGRGAKCVPSKHELNWDAYRELAECEITAKGRPYGLTHKKKISKTIKKIIPTISKKGLFEMHIKVCKVLNTHLGNSVQRQINLAVNSSEKNKLNYRDSKLQNTKYTQDKLIWLNSVSKNLNTKKNESVWLGNRELNPDDFYVDIESI